MGFPGVKDGRDTIVFFKPVDNNMAHLTLLGSGTQTDFDFVVQMFSVVHSTVKEVNGVVTELVLGPPSGPPTAMKLSNVNYSVLSNKLTIWSAGSTSYHVSTRHEL